MESTYDLFDELSRSVNTYFEVEGEDVGGTVHEEQVNENPFTQDCGNILSKEQQLVPTSWPPPIINESNIEIPQAVLQNVIASVHLCTYMDLRRIAVSARNAEYNPTKVNAVIIRVRNPKCTGLIFRSGKMMLTGAKSLEDIRIGGKKIAKLCLKIGHENIRFRGFKVENLIASAECGFPIRLEGLANDHNVFCSYEPELFPGLVYRYNPQEDEKLDDKEYETKGTDVSLCPSLNVTTTPVSTGTTIMAVEFDQGVILGADTRTSMGQYVVNRASRKISQVHHRIFVARSGSAADTQAITTTVKRFLSSLALELGENPRVNTAASLFQLVCYQNRDVLLAGLIVAGYDSRLGGQVYQIPLGGSRFRSPYALGGSGSSFISAYAESTFKKNMNHQDALNFVKTCIAYAIRSDSMSGGLIRLTTVTKDKVEEETHVANDIVL